MRTGRKANDLATMLRFYAVALLGSGKSSPIVADNNSSLVTALNANAETTRAQAAAQNTLPTAVLAPKQPGLVDLVDALSKLGRSGSPQTGGIKGTSETIKAEREISGPAPVAAGGDATGQVTSLVTSLAALDEGSESVTKERDKDESPKPRRNRILSRIWQTTAHRAVARSRATAYKGRSTRRASTAPRS